ncbi:MAG: MBL fold metallo-hydrolase [Syntrophomonas sp.]
MLEVFEFGDITGAMVSRELPWNPPFSMNVFYYIVSGLLIDSGPFSLADEAIVFFNTYDIKQVILTHIHEDHAGMAYWLQENKQIPIYLHPDSVEEALAEVDLPSYRLDIWGKRQAFKALPAPDKIKAGSHVFNLIDSPGHCRNHLVLYEKSKGWLFSGDLLNSLRPKIVYCEENLSEMIISMSKLLKLDFSTVFCPHTGIHTDGREKFTQKLNYLLNLQDKINRLRAAGLSDNEIDRQLFPGPSLFSELTEGDIASYHIIKTL